jgi:hypothetical protein
MSSRPAVSPKKAGGVATGTDPDKVKTLDQEVELRYDCRLPKGYDTLVLDMP